MMETSLKKVKPPERYFLKITCYGKMGYLVTEDYCWRKLILWSRLISFSRTKTFIVNVQAQ